MDRGGCFWNDPHQAARSSSNLRRKHGSDPKYPNLPMDLPDGQ